MEMDLQAALQRSLLAGGVQLTPAQVAGDLKGKEQKALIARLVEAGYVELTGKKYDVTDAGRTAWHDGASPADRAAVEDRPIVALLLVLEAKKGKLGKGDLAKHEAALAKAIARGLIADRGKSGYAVLLPGEALRLAQLPAEEQIAHARERLAAVQDEIAAIVAKVTRLLPAGFDPLDATKLLAPLEAQLTEWAAFATVQTLGSKLREELTRDAAAQSEAVADCKSAVAQVRVELDSAQARLTALETTVAGAVRKLEHMTPTAHTPTTPTPTHTPAVASATAPSEELWSATQKAYELLTKEGSVKIPELYDMVKFGHSHLTLKQYQEALLAWKDQGRLSLQPCSNRAAEERAAEGIESQKGLLFYVAMS